MPASAAKVLYAEKLTSLVETYRKCHLDVRDGGETGSEAVSRMEVNVAFHAFPTLSHLDVKRVGSVHAASTLSRRSDEIWRRRDFFSDSTSSRG